jgi:hypothetical protein
MASEPTIGATPRAGKLPDRGQQFVAVLPLVLAAA